jgi:oxalate decarboxylase
MLAHRRNFLEIAAWGAVHFSTLAVAVSAERLTVKSAHAAEAHAAHAATAPGATMEFRFPLDTGRPRVASGGWAKEVSVREFPIAHSMAGVHAFLDAGGSRELHWHATAAEWALVLGGRCQTVVIDPSGASEINNFEPGDLWYFAKGHGHAIQTIGDEPCNILLVFDDGRFTPDASAFSLTDWIDLTPKDLLAQEFSVPKDIFDAFPKGETFIQAGPILRPEDALEAPWPKESTHRFRLTRETKAARDFDGGSFRLATAKEFPASTTMSGGIMTLEPGAMRKLHWNVNADEWHYYLRGKGQVAIFGSSGRGKVAEFRPGDVAYIPQGFGHAIRNIGDEPLEIVQTWNSGAFEEIDLDQFARAAPRHLVANNLAGVPGATIDAMRRPRS